uniref:Uncharacterized protein n=1 Tax=Avena sativa TaxID=4498 RepID=A0ACD5UK02_AVESA
MGHIDKNSDYFAEAKEICSNLGMFPIMEFQYDYDPLLICQFYATAHFHNGRNRKITWMTQGAVNEATLAEFAAILGYEDRGRDVPCGFRCHMREHPSKKDVLTPLHIRGRGVAGKIKDLLPTYDILHRIFRETVAPRAGNKDEIHGFSVDLLFNTFLNRESGQPLDVTDFIWNEMVAAAHTRRVPPFAPYIMALIMSKCPVIARTLSTRSLVVHKPKALKIKTHAKPRVEAACNLSAMRFGEHGESAVLFLLLLMPLSATAQLCGHDVASSTYQSNLAAVAGTLPGNISSSPHLFATATAGEPPDVVYALALCRGDIKATACGVCVEASFKTCPTDVLTSTVYYDDCLLGLSSHGFLKPPNITEDGTLYQSWKDNIAGDADTIAAAVHELLAGTAHDAAANETRFATTVMDFISAASGKLYSLAQCTPDLSQGDCLACLQRLIAMVNATMATSGPKGGRILVLRCNIRFEGFSFYDSEPMRQINLSSVAPAPIRKRDGWKPWVIAISVAAPVVLALCFILYCCRIIKGKPEKPTHSLQGGDALVWEMEAEFPEFVVFNFHQILDATSNFSQENMLGEGGFGRVYKGYIPGRMDIAVKRLASHSGQGFLEFKNEVQLIAKLQHRNLIRLLGCCSEGEEKILVYEYMPNKSLDFFIFDENIKTSLDWNIRIVIIQGIIEGLLYLHKHSRLCVIHRDLKPSNILLDNRMNPKISDFGLAKIFSLNNTDENNTGRVVGTYGYMAPEYASDGIFSIKSDVFSFGVLTLEILSGKSNSGSYQCGSFFNLLGY